MRSSGDHRICGAGTSRTAAPRLMAELRLCSLSVHRSSQLKHLARAHTISPVWLFPSNRAACVVAYSHMTTARRHRCPKRSDPLGEVISNGRYPLRRFVRLGMPILRVKSVPIAAETALDKCVKTHVGIFTLAFVMTRLCARHSTSSFRETQLPSTSM